jgi:hypothetical protein
MPQLVNPVEHTAPQPRLMYSLFIQSVDGHREESQECVP